MAEELGALFARYKETGDIKIRNEIAEKYLYIAEILAKKFVGRGVPYDDLYQEASYALLRAIERFDPDQGVQFSTFVTPTITGELKNYFRDKARMVKLPRKLSELHIAVKKFCNEYATQEGVQPTVAEIASALGASEEDVIKALETGGTVSLDKADDGEKGQNKSLLDALPIQEDDYERIETREALKAAMKGLTDFEKKLIAYRFIENLSQMEAATRLGVSQMCVSRTERKLLLLLKERLQEEQDGIVSLYHIYDEVSLKKSLVEAHEALVGQGIQEENLFDCKLVFSELASNALKHVGSGKIEMQVFSDRVEFTLGPKETEDIPAKSRLVSVYEESGRGLYLIDSVALRRENTKKGLKVVVARR